MKAVDTWVLACLLFVFFCLAEYGIVLHLTSRCNRRKRFHNIQSACPESLVYDDDAQPPPGQHGNAKLTLWSAKRRAENGYERCHDCSLPSLSIRSQKRCFWKCKLWIADKAKAACTRYSCPSTSPGSACCLGEEHERHWSGQGQVVSHFSQHLGN